MIESIEFHNYKALRNTRLPLAPFTLLLGPNGSGKSSVLQALAGIAVASSQVPENNARFPLSFAASWLPARSITYVDVDAVVAMKLVLRWKSRVVYCEFGWEKAKRQVTVQLHYDDGKVLERSEGVPILQWLAAMRTFALDATAIAQPNQVASDPLQSTGAGLAATLDDLKDNQPERWELLLAELRRWLPEYDYIQFDKPQNGQKSIVLRTKSGRHRIKAVDLSQGTLVALALLTLAYLPNPPSLIGLEEIDRGLHPRLLRHLQDALYRLSYPESCGEKRPAIQVIATTHSPYLLDLYREHPEEVVLAEKKGLEVEMRRLTDIEHYDEILGESPLSEVWYSGVLGGAAVKP